MVNVINLSYAYCGECGGTPLNYSCLDVSVQIKGDDTTPTSIHDEIDEPYNLGDAILVKPPNS